MKRAVVAAGAVMLMFGGCATDDPEPPWKAEVRATMEDAIGQLSPEYLAGSCQGLVTDGVRTPEDALRVMEEEYGELTPEVVYPGADADDFDIPVGASLRDVLYIAAEVLLAACAVRA